MYTYECPVCHDTRVMRGVPLQYADAAAPSCWEHDEEVKMIRRGA